MKVSAIFQSLIKLTNVIWEIQHRRVKPRSYAFIYPSED